MIIAETCDQFFIVYPKVCQVNDTIVKGVQVRSLLDKSESSPYYGIYQQTSESMTKPKASAVLYRQASGPQSYHIHDVTINYFLTLLVLWFFFKYPITVAIISYQLVYKIKYICTYTLLETCSYI